AVVERDGEGLGCLQVIKHRPELVKRQQHVAEVEPNIDPQFPRGAVIRQVIQRVERLLEIPCRLAISRTRGVSLTRAPQIGDRLVPALQTCSGSRSVSRS